MADGDDHRHPHDDGSLAAAGGTGERIWAPGERAGTPPEEQTGEAASSPPAGGRFGHWWGRAPSEGSATGEAGARTFQPSPGTRTGVVFEHAGRTESHPEPGPTREIEGNVPPGALRPGMGADPPHLVHVVHHVTHSVPDGNQWWAALRLTVPITNPILIVPANPKRNRLTIVNLDAVNTVDLGVSPNMGAGSPATFPLAAGASIDMRHVREVYAIANAAAVVVAVKSEFAGRDYSAIEGSDPDLPWAKN